MTRGRLIAAICILLILSVSAKPYTMLIGSKSDPEAHLFSYDQKFRETTRFVNYNLSMAASKEFVDCRQLSTRMDLRSVPDWVEITIGASFTGIGRVGYVVYDPVTGRPQEEMSRISHMFIGNFTMDEHIRVIKDHKDETWFLPPPV
jgi:hypothetical protein